MTKFSNKFKKSFVFFKNSGCQAQHRIGFSHHAEFQKKLMSQFQENFWTEGQADPNSWEPSSHSQGSNKVK